MKINNKITGYKVVDATEASVKPLAEVVQMHEMIDRPDKLIGTTYKLKVPEHVSQHAMYITINDIVLNEGTEHETRRPFEVFLNSKNLDNYQWTVAMTRIISAVFRKGGDIKFLVDELGSVFDPRGGYWNKGKYMPSIIAEIGDILEKHLIDTGVIKSQVVDEVQAKIIEDKKAELGDDWMKNASLCPKCNEKAVVVRDGCATCMNCGDSKCG